MARLGKMQCWVACGRSRVNYMTAQTEREWSTATSAQQRSPDKRVFFVNVCYCIRSSTEYNSKRLWKRTYIWPECYWVENVSDIHIWMVTEILTWRNVLPPTKPGDILEIYKCFCQIAVSVSFCLCPRGLHILCVQCTPQRCTDLQNNKIHESAIHWIYNYCSGSIHTPDIIGTQTLRWHLLQYWFRRVTWSCTLPSLLPINWHECRLRSG